MSLRNLDKLQFIVLFSAAFAASSFLFSFSSWGSAVPEAAQAPPLDLDLAIHMSAHALLGALAALPTLEVTAVVTTALCAMAIDVDHIGFFLGLPMDGRPSHGVPFALLVAAILYSLARRGLFGRRVTSAVAGVLGLAAVLAHMALDSITGDPMMPVWMPFYRQEIAVEPLVGVLIEVAAVLAVWAATTRPTTERIEKGAG